VSHFPTIRASAAEIHSHLRAAVPEAIATGNPLAPVWAPGFCKAFITLEDLLTDELADGSGYLRQGVLALMKAALVSTDPAIRISTQALVNEWAKKHAEYHLDDALENARVAA